MSVLIIACFGLKTVFYTLGTLGTATVLSFWTVPIRFFRNA